MIGWDNPYRRRWYLFGVLATVFLLVNLYRLSTAVLFEDLMVAFQTTGAQLGTLHAMFFWIYAVMQIPTGLMADRYGPRLTAGVGAVTMNAGAVVFAAAWSYSAALGGRFLIGLGASVIFVSMLRFCANWYEAGEFGKMNGMSFAVGGIGGILSTAPLAVVAGALGWRVVLGSLGILGFGLALVILGVVRDSPRRAGLESVTGVEQHGVASARALRGHLEGVLRDRWTWVIGVLLFCTGGINLTIFGLWGVPYVVQTYGVSVAVAGLFTLLGGVGILTGPPLIGWVADRYGHHTHLVVAGSVGFTIALGSLSLVDRPPMAWVAVAYFLAGWLFGAFVLTYPLIRARHPAQASGVALGTINGASFFGAAVMPALLGFVLDAYWTGELVGGVRVYTAFGYRIAFAIAGVCGLVALVCGFWLHRRRPPAVVDGGPGSEAR